jgi:hypothetical protein
MKPSILAATVALLMSTAAQAENTTILFSGNHWSTKQIARTYDDGASMCVMETRLNWGKEQGRFWVKYTAAGGLFLQIIKSNWKMPKGKVVPITITSDHNKVDLESQTTKLGPNEELSGLEISLTGAESWMNFLADVRYSDNMTISFKLGNEKPWPMKMIGTRKATDAFASCMTDIDPIEPTAPTQPFSSSKNDESPVTYQKD